MPPPCQKRESPTLQTSHHYETQVNHDWHLRRGSSLWFESSRFVFVQIVSVLCPPSYMFK
ncbi:hypothetical protein TanjilG_23789 [Lupinus angustifolius]|nr:hypothetical protein TanjilG_23789 [Lupinus angustifolius]